MANYTIFALLLWYNAAAGLDLILRSLYIKCPAIILSHQRGGFLIDKTTIMFTSNDKLEKNTTKEILTAVFDSLNEKGYNAIDQIVGYILSGDPSYITSHNNARNLIRHIERDDLVEELLCEFLKK